MREPFNKATDANLNLMQRELLHILAQFALGSPVSEQASAWGVAALAAGHDTEASRVLAGLSTDTPREQIAPWLRRVADDFGVRLPTHAESRWLVTLIPKWQARELALDIVDGRIGLIEGSVRLARSRWEIEPAAPDLRHLFTPFVAVSSETDHLPLADDRAHWNADALRAKDDEARSYEESARPAIVVACRALAAALERDADRVAAFFAPVS